MSQIAKSQRLSQRCFAEQAQKTDTTTFQGSWIPSELGRIQRTILCIWQQTCEIAAKGTRLFQKTQHTIAHDIRIWTDMSCMLLIQSPRNVFKVDKLKPFNRQDFHLKYESVHKINRCQYSNSLQLIMIHDQ